MTYFEIRKNDQGNYWVVEIADNGEILNTSEMLESKQAARKNAEAASATQTVHMVDATGEQGG